MLGALVLRAAFIAVGAAALEAFAVTFVLFGAFLVYTAIRLVRTHGEPERDLTQGRAMRALRRVVPVTADYSADGALLSRRGGRRVATPMLAVVTAILSVDIVFALDSIPAIFGITQSAYLVFTANAFALLGLRALYFLLLRAARAAGVPGLRAGAGAGVHRRQTGAALPAHRVRRRPGDPHLGEAWRW